MAINVFEGARRIALALGGLWAAGCLAYAVLSEPHVSLTYAVQSYGAMPTPAETCDSKDASKYITAVAPGGERVSVTLCFVADRAENGSYLIPYRQIVSSSNPEAARVYAARKEALRQGAHSEASRLAEYLFKMPIDPAEPPTVWMASEHDSDVRAYMEETAASFKLLPHDLERVQQVRRQKLWEQWKQALQVLFGGLAIGWALTACIGWIARGFMGVPRGRDQRPVPRNPQGEST